jgi:hypothetical protein
MNRWVVTAAIIVECIENNTKTGPLILVAKHGSLYHSLLGVPKGKTVGTTSWLRANREFELNFPELKIGCLHEAGLVLFPPSTVAWMTCGCFANRCSTTNE